MHHAYFYYGALSLLHTLVQDARERFGFIGEHNPDVQIREYEKFGIDEARELQAKASLRSSSGRALYIVGVSQLTTEAQQALLKLFEEPQAGAIFVLLAPHGSVIATLRSRLLGYPVKLQESPEQNGLARVRRSAIRETRGPFERDFLAAPYKTRSETITKLLKDEDGIRERVREFLNALEQILYASLGKAKIKKEITVALEDIAKVRSYANDRSPSMKMLLEHLALALPKL